MTAQVTDRVKTAQRLLASSAKNSYDPLLDIDWDAPLPEGLAFLPFERVSLYGTPLWDELTPEQRVELSKNELASIASTGLWTEIILMQMLVRDAYHRDPRDPGTQYALTEVGDETRHVIMFAKALERLGCPEYRPPRFVHHLARFYKATARGPAMYAPVLVTEEVTDRLQRSTMNDEAIHPLIRMVNRIHVVEEARHVRYARGELSRMLPQLSRPRRGWHNLVAAIAAASLVRVLIDPKVYASVGLDPKQASRVARANPHHRETVRWMGEKIMAFLDEQGMVTRTTRPIYRAAHLL
ncbi:MAG TPA: diiron oxygenase [Jatrophihabitantaceae bacterium]|nr:diiron oxygenase [Jatrophihabitantaceae bacterium]